MGKTRTKRAACQEGRMSAGEANVGEGDVTEGGQEPRRIIKSQPKEHHSHQEWRDKGKQRWDWSWYNCPHLRERECHLSDQFLQYINIIIGPWRGGKKKELEKISYQDQTHFTDRVKAIMRRSLQDLSTNQ